MHAGQRRPLFGAETHRRAGVKAAWPAYLERLFGEGMARYYLSSTRIA
jgi:hypothetical protein